MGWLRSIGRRPRAWLAAGLVAVASVAVLAAVLLAEPLRATVYDLDETSVWLTNEQTDRVGRANLQIAQLEKVIEPQRDVLQSGDDVLLFDREEKRLVRLDPTTATESDPITLDAEEPWVVLGGGVVALIDKASGQVWIAPAESPQELGGSEPPVMELGAGGTVVAGLDGTVVGVGADGMVQTVPPGGTSATGLPLQGAADLGEIDVTVADGRAVVLDREGLRLLSADHEPIGLDGMGDGPRLSLAGWGPEVLVATDDGLFEVQRDGNRRQLDDGGTGTASRPVEVGGCAFAAWEATPRAVVVCEDRDPVFRELTELAPGSRVVVRSNGASAAFNAPADGHGFVHLDGELRTIGPRDWEDEPLPPEERPSEELPPETLPEVDEKNTPPVAKNDDLGARAGRQTILKVLDNDTDADRDVLMVSAIDPRGVPEGALRIVQGGKAVSLTLPDEASPSYTFGYTVTDGHPGGEHAADVTVEVVDEAVNNPPELIRQLAPWRVESGRSIGDDVLRWWRDPEGDPIVLVAAAPAAGTDHRVRHSADGQVTFTASAAAGATVIDLTVSDGRAQGTGQQPVEVAAAGTGLPPVARNDLVVTAAGSPVQVRPLDNDTDPNGQVLTLADVSWSEQNLPPGTTVVPDLAGGIVSIDPKSPGSFVLRYVVEDADGETAEAWIRVEVSASGGPNRAPQAVADAVLVAPGGEATVDLLANDFDPDGDVLIATKLVATEVEGLRVVLRQHRYLTVYAEGELSDPAELRYLVSDGQALDEGTVLVAGGPVPDENLPPSALDDRAVVRVGDVVSVPVLGNDTDPEGDDLRVTAATIVSGPADLTAQDVVHDAQLVRVRAPSDPTPIVISYQVTDEGANNQNALVTVDVRAKGANAAPRPLDLEARLRAGRTVDIVVPLDGIDPDGDSVRLVGLDPESVPVKGAVSVPQPDVLRYEAFPQTSGTDTFSYRVVDRQGQAARATVRVGIAPTDTENQSPVAAPDEFELRPGATASLAVLDNDVDPDGDALSLLDPEDGAAGRGQVERSGDRLVVTAPSSSGGWAVPYRITDGRGGYGDGIVSISVRDDGAGSPPVARDDHVDASADPQVRVDVLANDSDADGDVSSYQPELEPDVSGARVEDRAVVAELTDAPRILKYSITDGDGLTASAFVWLPARTGGDVNHAPVARIGVEPVQVRAGESVSIDVDDHAVDPDGDELVIVGQPRASGLARVEAQDGDTVVFYAPAGKTDAQVVVTVADGDEGPPTALETTITIDVEVLPPENTPPDLLPGSFEVEALKPFTVDLFRANAVVDDDRDQLRFRLEPVTWQGVQVEIDERTGVVSVDAGVDADVSAEPREVVVVVTDEAVEGEGREQELALRFKVVETRLREPDANPDGPFVVQWDERETFDVLENDLNPLGDVDGGGPLRIVKATVTPLTGAGELDWDERSITFSARKPYLGAVAVTYTVRDVRDREASAVLSMTVRGTPGKPGAPVATPTDGAALLVWPAASANGAPIRSHTVEYQSEEGRGGTKVCEGPGTSCTVDGLDNGVGVRFQVVAENEVGPGEVSEWSAFVVPDRVPDAPGAPTVKVGNGGATLEWAVEQPDGTPLSSYQIRTCQNPGEVRSVPVQAGARAMTLPWKPLPNDIPVTFALQAQNAEGPSEWGACSDEVIPFGPPLKVEGIAATSEGERITVTFSAAVDNGRDVDAYALCVNEEPCTDYQAEEVCKTTPCTIEFSRRKVRINVSVYAKNEGGNGERSDVVPVVTYDIPALAPWFIPLGADTPVLAQARAESVFVAVKVTDNGGQRNVRLEYQYQVAGGPWNDKVIHWVQEGEEDHHRFEGLQAGSTYAVRVRACNEEDKRPESCSEPLKFDGLVPFASPEQPTITVVEEPVERGDPITFEVSWTNGDPDGTFEISACDDQTTEDDKCANAIAVTPVAAGTTVLTFTQTYMPVRGNSAKVVVCDHRVPDAPACASATTSYKAP